MKNKGEHLGYIDFIKGVAIVSVILLHASRRHLLLLTHAYLHIWQAVPLFVFVSFFLLFRKMEHTDISTYFSKSSFLKLFRRIIIPFIILQFFVLIYYYVRNDFHQIHILFKAGGLGPGSYYPYLYLQLWLLSPFLYKLLKKSVLQWGLVIMFVTLIINLVIYYTNAPLRIESMCLNRYLFLSVAAFVWLQDYNNKLWRYVLPIISLVYWFWGMNYDMNPWLLARGPRGGWGLHQLPALFYTFFMVWLLYQIYCRFIVGNNKLKLCLEWLGRNSYEIFMLQMFYFITPTKDFLFIDNYNIRIILMVITPFVFSILPIFIYNRLKIVYQKNKLYV